MDIEYKKTLLIVNPEALRARITTETLVVCGSARGMTSVVSFALYELGYFVGNDLQLHNYEDYEFQDIFHNQEPPLAERPAFTDLVAKRNAEHVRWGFKVPAAINFVDQITDVFRNPICVLCVRNPLATAMSVARRNPNVRGGNAQIFRGATKSIRAMAKLTANPELPSILINMEEAQSNPLTFLEEISEILQIEGDLPAIAEAMSSRGYKKSEARPGVTFSRPAERAGKA